MRRHRRAAFSALELLVIVAILGFVFGFLMVAVMKARQAAKRIESVNNLKQIGIALHSYHDANNNLPSGNDKNNFSTYVHLLPFLELNDVSKLIDTTKPVSDKANDKARATPIKLFVSPQDPVQKVKDGMAPTNYVFCAGSLNTLTDNNGVFGQDSKLTLGVIANANGTSNTMAVAETLKGDGGTKAVDVRRQHVALNREAFRGLKEELGVGDWKEGKSIAGNRCASWLDGRFMQTTFTATRLPDDPRPDVDLEGLGGFSALRSLDGRIPVLFCDGHVQSIPTTIAPKIWKLMANWKNGEAFQLP